MGQKGVGSCTVQGCKRRELARGWCSMHYSRWRKYGTTGDAEERRSPSYQPGTVCSVDGCTTPVQARGWCPGHYQRWRLYGDPLGTAPERPRRTAKDVVADIAAGRGGTTDPRGYVYYTLTLPDGTKRRKGAHVWVMEDYLGRELLPGEEVHHKHGDRSDNRLKHLELWTHSHPSGQRVEDMVAFARGIIERYGDYVPPS